MSKLTSICVYCGSSDRGPDSHQAVARELGALMAARGIDLVYGGGRVGVMGTIADAVMAHGGTVTGIIPGFMMKLEVGHTDITNLEIVENMHERKARMAELSDAFLILPGGLGTLEEFFEILTWRYLGLHDKPIAILNTGGYWTELENLLSGLVAANYARAETVAFAQITDTPEQALDVLLAEMSGDTSRLDRDKL